MFVKTARRTGSDIKRFFLFFITTELHCGAIVLYDLHPTLIV